VGWKKLEDTSDVRVNVGKTPERGEDVSASCNYPERGKEVGEQVQGGEPLGG